MGLMQSVAIVYSERKAEFACRGGGDAPSFSPHPLAPQVIYTTAQPPNAEAYDYKGEIFLVYTGQS